jgi:hypothetical protein
MTLALFILLALSQEIKAEYRVFLLQFRGSNGQIQKEFPSTLDPLQYAGYYSVPKNVTVLYSDTWMCPGSTADFKPLCSSPRNTKPDLPAPPASTLPSPPSTAPPIETKAVP